MARKRSAAEEVVTMSRRLKVAEWVVKGVKHGTDIARAMGLPANQFRTIQLDLVWLNDHWKKEALQHIDVARGRELAKLDQTEKEAWEAWERSKQPGERISTKKQIPPQPLAPLTNLAQQVAPPSPKPLAPDEETKDKIFRDGDPRFLEIVLKCISKRCEILGITAEARKGAQPGAGSEEESALTPQEEAKAIEQLIARAGIKLLPNYATNGHTNGNGSGHS